MKLKLIIGIGILANQFYVKAQTESGLGFHESVEQAKRQMNYLLARDVPVKASLNTLEDYYIDHEERDLPLLPQYSRPLRRPCKILPDPDPGLVNPRLVEPVHKYKPLFRNEKFYGKFAPPIKFEIVNNNTPIVGAAPLPPITQIYNNPNPFNGYQGNYDASNEYFQVDTESIKSKYQISEDNTGPYIVATTTFPSASTISTNPTSWVSDLSVDYSLRLASLSSLLSSNSAAMASMSFSIKMESMSSVFAQKEASLRSKLSQYSATATSTTNRMWHW